MLVTPSYASSENLGGVMQEQHNSKHEILDLMALVREVVHDYGSTTRTHTIKYRGDTSHSYTILGDRESLRTVLLHLLANVVQSLEAIHDVCISVLPDQEFVTVMVEECERSMHRRERSMGFLPFVPLEKAVSGMEEPDLNLALVKVIAEHHFATVTMQGSRGQGTAFSVKFRSHKG